MCNKDYLEGIGKGRKDYELAEESYGKCHLLTRPCVYGDPGSHPPDTADCMSNLSRVVG